MVDREWGQESEWLRRARTGDTGAYELLLAPVLADASRLAYGLLQDRSMAEDSVQEAAILAWRRLENVEAGRPFRPWFLGIVANRCREALRSRWRSVVPLPDEDEAWTGDTPWTGDGGWLEGADLRRALAELPHGHRLAIVLHFYLDLPLEEVSSVLGLGIAGVKARINRGLRRLRRALEAER